MQMFSIAQFELELGFTALEVCRVASIRQVLPLHCRGELGPAYEWEGRTYDLVWLDPAPTTTDHCSLPEHTLEHL